MDVQPSKPATLTQRIAIPFPFVPDRARTDVRVASDEPAATYNKNTRRRQMATETHRVLTPRTGLNRLTDLATERDSVSIHAPS